VVNPVSILMHSVFPALGYMRVSSRARATTVVRYMILEDISVSMCAFDCRWSLCLIESG